MEKVIIHNHIDDISYAFTLAEVAYRDYLASEEYEEHDDIKFDFNGSRNVTVIARRNDKSVTIIVKEKKMSKTVFYTDNDGESHEAEVESIDGDYCIISFKGQTLRVSRDELDWEE